MNDDDNTSLGSFYMEDNDDDTISLGSFDMEDNGDDNTSLGSFDNDIESNSDPDPVPKQEINLPISINKDPKNKKIVLKEKIKNKIIISEPKQNSKKKEIQEIHQIQESQIPENCEPSKSKNKSTIKSKEKSEENFEFNTEIIDLFTKDLNPKKILIKHPPNSLNLEKINDTTIICLLIKIGHFKDYCCTTSKCKVEKFWNGKPIQLILNRKNSIQNDLSINNLELICANCFMVTYGLDIFIKKKKEAILNCSFCEFPLVKFKDNRKKKGICLSCEYKMKQISENKQEDTYFKKLKDTYSDNPVLSEDIKPVVPSYIDSSKYKNYNKSKIKNSGNFTNTNSLNNIKPPIIELNMNIPDLSDLINDD